MNVPEKQKPKGLFSLKRLSSLPQRYIRLGFLTLKIRGRNLRWSLRRFTKRTPIVLLALVAGLALYWVFLGWNWIALQIGEQDPQVLSTFLIGVATVIAGVLALLFSVSLFVIQNAADNYTPTTLERFVGDKVSVVLYSFIGISSLFIFCSSMFVTNQSDKTPLLVVASLTLLALTFALAYWHYSRMANMVNPLKQLIDWQKASLAQIRSVERNMTEMVEWLKLKRGGTPIKDVKPEEYESLSKVGFYLREPTIQTSLQRKLNQIFSITKRAGVKRDYEVAESGLTAASNVLRSYLAARQDSTVPLPTDRLMSFRVDYDALFDQSFQQLQEICRIAVTNSDENLIRRVVDTIAGLGVQSVEVVPMGDIVRNNPITGLSILYISGIVDEGSRHNFTDVCLSGVAGIRSIVQHALAKKVPLVFEEAREPLKKIALIGLVHRKSYIFDKVMEALGAISHQVVEMNHFHVERVVEDCIEDAKKLTVLSVPLIEEGGLQGSMNVTNYLGSFYDLTRQTAIPYVSRLLPPKFKGKSYDDQDAIRAFHDFVDVNKLLWRFYRDLGEEVGKTESFMLFYIHQGIMENVKTILAILQDKAWTFERKELENLVSWHLSFYWVTFEAHERISKNLYMDMVDFLGWLGVLSVKNLWLGIAESCVGNISSIAREYIEKGESYHFDAPRIFMKAIHILMVARKKPVCQRISDLAVTELTKFHSLFVEKLTAADPTKRFLAEFKSRLLIEIAELRRDFHENEYNRRTLREAQNLLFGEVDEADFDAAEEIVRGIIDPPEPVAAIGSTK